MSKNADMNHRTSPIRRAISTLLKNINRVVGWQARFLTQLSGAIDVVKFKYVDFVARSDDVFIVSYPRSGTTLLQMMLFQLTTDGNMDFQHISHIIPHFERFIYGGKNIEALPCPRIFKTHLQYRWRPLGPCKFIYVARDGKDVAVSYYHFHVSHRGFRRTFAQFLKLFFEGKLLYGSWFKHVAGWWAHKDDPRVLFIRYEDLLFDMEGCIRKIAGFCDLQVTAEKIETVKERCSFEFMKKHENKFDLMTEVMEQARFEPNSFIRKGCVGDWKQIFDVSQEKEYEQEFEKRLGKSGIEFQSISNPAPMPKSAQFTSAK